MGQTMNSLERRIIEHISRAKKGNYPIRRAIKKYGIQSFEFAIIDQASSKEILDAKECYWIANYNCQVPNGYNLTGGGEGIFGYHHSEETRRKISDAHRGTHPTEETRHKMSKAKKGKWGGEKSCWFGKTGEKHPRFGKHHTVETRKKMSEAHMGEKNPMFGKPSTKGMQDKHHTNEARQKISAIGMGKHHTEETRKKMSATRTGKKHPHRGKYKMEVE